MNQFFTFDKPIPSLPVYKLQFKNGKWNYVYRIQTPVALRDTKRKEPLYIDGSFLNLKLVKEKSEFMVNVRIYCKKDLIKLFNKQRIADNKMRKEFNQIKDTLDIGKLEEHTFTLKNKNQLVYNCWIVRAKNIGKKETVFVGRN